MAVASRSPDWVHAGKIAARFRNQNPVIAESSPALFADHFANLLLCRRRVHRDRANHLLPRPAPPDPKTLSCHYKFCAAFSHSVPIAFAHLELPERKTRDAARNIQTPLSLRLGRAK